MNTKTRRIVTDLIAAHGFNVTDDGSHWHIVVPWVDATRQLKGYETVTCKTWNQVKTTMGY